MPYDPIQGQGQGQGRENGRFQRLSPMSVGMHVIKRLAVNYHDTPRQHINYNGTFLIIILVRHQVTFISASWQVHM